jgi:hypothetical protein
MRVDDLLFMCLFLFEFYAKVGMMITIFKFVCLHRLPTVAKCQLATVVASQKLAQEPMPWTRAMPAAIGIF